MKDIEMKDELDALMQGADSRRSFLARVAVAGLGVAALGLIKPSEVEAATKPKQPEAETGHNYPMAKPTARTEAQFRKGLSGPAKLSLLTSQIAVDKATHPKVLEFANFELREAIGVTTVLKNLNTPVPELDAVAKATLEKIKSTPKGAEFDKIYITAQLANHEFLRDLADVYLKNSAGRTSMAEMHMRNIVTLASGLFREHVVLTKDILHMMAM